MKLFKNIAIITLVMVANVIGVFAQDSAIPQNKNFIVQSAMNYGKNLQGCWDIPGIAHIAKGKNLEVYQYDKACDQHFFVSKIDAEGYCSIYTCNNAKLAIDVGNGGRANGTNVLLWDTHQRDNQKFKFHHLGNGRYKIEAKTGGYLCLDGRRNGNGTNIHIWENHDGPWMEWYLLDLTTKKAYIPAQKENIKSLEKENIKSVVPDKVNIEDRPETEESENDEEVFFVVEDMPSFQGGTMNNVRSYIAQNLQYPESVKENGVEGRVFVSFVVNKFGNVTQVKVVRSVDPDLDKEAVRVIKSLPRFTPGKQRGKAVNVKFTFPIVFVL